MSDWNLEERQIVLNALSNWLSQSKRLQAIDLLIEKTGQEYCPSCPSDVQKVRNILNNLRKQWTKIN